MRAGGERENANMNDVGNAKEQEPGRAVSGIARDGAWQELLLAPS